MCFHKWRFTCRISYFMRPFLRLAMILYRTLLADFIPWSTFASQLLFQDRDVSPVPRQSAADFLGWLICPSSSEGRASATSEFLRAAEDWQSLCDEETQVGSAGRLLHRREAVCNFCGSPLNGTGDLVNGVSNSSASQNLVAWLLRICKLQQGGHFQQSFHLECS